jgi:hypothetical protein
MLVASETWIHDIPSVELIKKLDGGSLQEPCTLQRWTGFWTETQNQSVKKVKLWHDISAEPAEISCHNFTKQNGKRNLT